MLMYISVCVRHVRLTVSVDNANAECINAERERGKEGGREEEGRKNMHFQ